MYIPNAFKIDDKEEIYTFVEANAFGQLISKLKGRLFSSHIPLLLSEDKTKLIGHLALQNPQHEELDGQEILVSLEGPHDYISPSWYSSPGVPTWNYQAVHIYGECAVFHNTEKLKRVVDELTTKYESAFEDAWKPEYKSTMLSGIVGIEITINEIQCKYKLSQNRSSQDQSQVVEQLQALGSNRLAESMQKLRISETKSD